MIFTRQIVIVSLFFMIFIGWSECALAKVITVNKKRYHSVQNLCSRYNLRAYSQRGGVVLHNAKTRVELTLNRREAVINRVKHTLSFPIIYQGGTFVSESDMVKILDPILNPKSLISHGNRVIVIDPGHGGKDNGASGQRYNEKAITIALARMVSATLKKMGYRVYLTRNGDTYVPLSSRADFANRVKADLFVSIHVNAAGNRSVTGIECFALTPIGAPSSNSSSPSWKRYDGTHMEANSGALAHSVQQQLIRYTNAVDRGVKRSRFVVLRETKMPSVLIETGFISNSAEEQKLVNASYLNALTRGIVNGIILYQRSMLQGRP